MPFSGLEVGLLDVGRFVALNGYALACHRLAFVARDFYGEDDYLVATKYIKYGGKQRTRLMSLARKGDKRRVSLLLKVGADVEARDADGQTPLLLASEGGHASVVRTLLAKGANIDAEDARGRTALHLASRGGHVDVVRLLLARSADVTVKDADGRTALHLASIGGYTEVVRLLLEVEGIDVNASDADEWTALLHAEHRRRHAVTALLVGAGADLDYTDENMETVLGWAIARGDMVSVRRLVALGAAVSGEYITYLHQACAAGNVELVRLLLEREEDDKKRDLDRKDENGWTPLHHAEDNGHHAVTAVLVGAGAYMDAENEQWRTVLDWAVANSDEASVHRLVALGATLDIPDHYDFGVTVPLHKASEAGNVAMVELLLELGAKVDTDDGRGWSALLNAARNGHIDVIEVLAEAHASVGWCDGGGTDAFDCAMAGGHLDTVRLLVRLGLELDIPDHYKFGVTVPLHKASEAGNVAMVELLIELGAKVDTDDGRGWSALLNAAHSGHIDVIAVLVGAGARVGWCDWEGTTALTLMIKRSDDDASIRRLVGLGAKIQKDGWRTAPLHVASRAGRVKAVRALLELGADVDAREGSTWEGNEYSGPTALHIACEMGFAETARALVEGGADAAARDEEGRTPLGLAVRNGNTETAAVVEEAVKAKAAAGGV
jgi:ankyrin repeat protein